ncbi:MAG: hypothetical protein NXH75_03535 [Halobacteriovoraceae bacterium]|nr:hypothetical protein [Halobacteriovoraceae bacterium]
MTKIVLFLSIGLILSSTKTYSLSCESAHGYSIYILENKISENPYFLFSGSTKDLELERTKFKLIDTISKSEQILTPKVLSRHKATITGALSIPDKIRNLEQSKNLKMVIETESKKDFQELIVKFVYPDSKFKKALFKKDKNIHKYISPESFEVKQHEKKTISTLKLKYRCEDEKEIGAKLLYLWDLPANTYILAQLITDKKDSKSISFPLIVSDQKVLHTYFGKLKNYARLTFDFICKPLIGVKEYNFRLKFLDENGKVLKEKYLDKVKCD